MSHTGLLETPRARVFLGLAVVALLFGFFVLRSKPEEPKRPDKAALVTEAPVLGPRPSKTSLAMQDEGAGTGESSPSKEALPRSLEGTDIDGGLDVGPDGHLVLGPRILQLFDYFLSAEGEESKEALVDRIRAYIDARLDEPALSEAHELLDKVLDYREAGRTLNVSKDATAKERYDAVRELRRSHFGDDADALFGDEERLASVSIEKSRIAQDPTLSEEERQDLLEEADKNLPESVKASQAKATSVLSLRDDEAALRSDGADEDAIFRYRESKFGTAAAERLKKLDEERAVFKARIEAFLIERDKKCGQGASGSDCESSLLNATFDDRERIRVRAMLSK